MTEDPTKSPAVSERACICPANCHMTEDRHFINCPAHQYYEAYLARLAPAPEKVVRDVLAEMKPWNGGERAPDDWHGGHVKRRDGQFSMLPTDMHPAHWRHDNDHNDIIAYKSVPVASSFSGLAMSDDELTQHYERSKRDILLVGSEVRQIIGELRHWRARAALAQPEAARGRELLDLRKRARAYLYERGEGTALAFLKALVPPALTDHEKLEAIFDFCDEEDAQPEPARVGGSDDDWPNDAANAERYLRIVTLAEDWPNDVRREAVMAMVGWAENQAFKAALAQPEADAALEDPRHG